MASTGGLQPVPPPKPALAQGRVSVKKISSTRSTNSRSSKTSGNQALPHLDLEASRVTRVSSSNGTRRPGRTSKSSKEPANEDRPASSKERSPGDFGISGLGVQGLGSEAAQEAPGAAAAGQPPAVVLTRLQPPQPQAMPQTPVQIFEPDEVPPNNEREVATPSGRRRQGPAAIATRAVSLVANLLPRIMPSPTSVGRVASADGFSSARSANHRHKAAIKESADMEKGASKIQNRWRSRTTRQRTPRDMALVRMIYDRARTTHMNRESYNARNQGWADRDVQKIFREVLDDVQISTHECLCVRRTIEDHWQPAVQESKAKLGLVSPRVRAKTRVVDAIQGVFSQVHKEDNAESMWQQLMSSLPESMPNSPGASHRLTPRSWRLKPWSTEGKGSQTPKSGRRGSAGTGSMGLLGTGSMGLLGRSRPTTPRSAKNGGGGTGSMGLLDIGSSWKLAERARDALRGLTSAPKVTADE